MLKKTNYLLMFSVFLVIACSENVSDLHLSGSNESSDISMTMFNRYADYEQIDYSGKSPFRRDESGLIASGAEIASSVNDLKALVEGNVQAASESDSGWWATFRYDMNSWDHPLHCGYTKGGDDQRFLSSEDAVVLGLPDSIFTRKLCGSCLKIEYTNKEGDVFTEVAIVADKGYRNQMPKDQLDLSPGMSSFFNNYGLAVNIGKRNQNGDLKVTPVECIYDNDRKLSYFMEGHWYWRGINVRRLPLPLLKMSICVKSDGKNKWKEVFQEKNNISRKWIFKPNDGNIDGAAMKFKLEFLHGKTFYDEIDLSNGEFGVEHKGKNKFGPESENNCI